jgi:hypothetical protein
VKIATRKYRRSSGLVNPLARSCVEHVRRPWPAAARGWWVVCFFVPAGADAVAGAGSLPCQLSLRAGRAAQGHTKAIGAVARDVAEATYWILSKGEGYREPRPSGRFVHGG